MKPLHSNIRKQIIQDIEAISSPRILLQILDFLRLFKGEQRISSNRKAVMAFAGSISDEEAKEMTETIDREFNQIEGDW